MSILTGILGKVVQPISEVIKEAIPDKDLATKLDHKIQTLLIEQCTKMLDAQKSIIIAETKGGILARNWRPLSMLLLVGSVVAHFFGLTDDKLSDAEVEWMMRIIAIGLGGYVAGRSGAKIMSAYTQAKK